MAGSRVKSPHYPSINLETAIKTARKVEKQIGRGPLARDTAIASGLGLSSKSSSGQRMLAALLSFGLWEKAGKGQVKLSERGRRILAAPDLSMAAKELREAALMPKIHRRVMQQWPEGLPTEDTGMLGYLRMEWDFNPDAAAPFIREVRDSFTFGKVYENATLPLDLGDNGDDDEDAEIEDRVENDVEYTPLRAPQSGAKVPVPSRPPPGPRTIEMTSFPLVGGGRLVIEAPFPTPSDQILKLATMITTITQYLQPYIAKPDPVDPKDTLAGP